MTRTKRKLDHIEHALTIGQEGKAGFHDLMFVHQSLPDINVDEIDLTTEIGELTLSSPIFINAMTGGGGEETKDINRAFAMVAKETGIGMAVGSQMAAIKDSSQISTYKIVREMNPKGIIIGNLGAEATADQAKLAIEMIEANALQIHLNVIQELTMPEGDRSFAGALTRIEQIVNSVEVPVIVKEVGFGMSKETVDKLTSVGVTIVDVGGFGGTNFAKIENNRRNRGLSYFNQWGISTVCSIMEAKSVGKDLTVIASGGIKDSLDIVKSLALGAKATGLAGLLLKVYKERGFEALKSQIEDIQEDIKLMMVALGKKKIEDLNSAPYVLLGHSLEWAKQRNLLNNDSK
ncbi:type 2 isopentenyl-diphosphate Delta-isomerase [Peribacillus alkalitolerans]|uniref:type 2 isopentenyl-diphosphate Delta-isomerase n=1 Tax=Peribacillus alkalitolerans TaxID=1550385 RepID=UPI0013D7E953|nr:type 2 isopentenyl-diphosphate Delta-isomerase [Peribacillus alkalitolerans]